MIEGLFSHGHSLLFFSAEIYGYQKKLFIIKMELNKTAVGVSIHTFVKDTSYL